MDLPTKFEQKNCWDRPLACKFCSQNFAHKFLPTKNLAWTSKMLWSALWSLFSVFLFYIKQLIINLYYIVWYTRRRQGSTSMDLTRNFEQKNCLDQQKFGSQNFVGRLYRPTAGSKPKKIGLNLQKFVGNSMAIALCLSLVYQTIYY